MVTESFADLAYLMRKHNNHPDLQVLVLPYPLEDQHEDYVREIARTSYPGLLEMLGAARG